MAKKSALPHVKKSRKPDPGKPQPQLNPKAPDSKLISIRIPTEMMEQLRQVASRQDDMGYQQLIKTYVAEALDNVKAAEPGTPAGRKAEASGEPVHYRQTGKVKFGTAARGKNKDRSNVAGLAASRVIADDIKALAGHLKPYYAEFEGRTFLVTGAFGFLGRYIVLLFKYLNEHVLDQKIKALLLDNFVTGYEQGVISDENLRFVKHDVIKPYSAEGPVDYLIHAAGIASPVYYTKFPIETMDVGTQGTRNMLELAYRKNVKSFLFTSSSEVYGDPDPAHVPTAEDYYGNVSITGPRSCYDESKRFGETMCLAFWRTFHVPVKIVRPFNVYGPGIRPDDYRVLPNFIEHALRKEPLPIHGPGHNTRSFCYINDAIEGIFRILFSEHNGESFNVGNPHPEISVKELGRKVAKMMPYRVEVVHIEPPHAVYASSDPKRRCPDITKIQQLTGYRPRYPLDEGLRRTIQWFSEF